MISSFGHELILFMPHFPLRGFSGELVLSCIVLLYAWKGCDLVFLRYGESEGIP